MTGASNVKLLPPPKWLLEGFTDPTIEILCDYTRACVAHATAAKDAEIEALRAEVNDYRENGASAVRFAPSSAHWSAELRRLFGSDARDGIDRLEERLRAAEQNAARWRFIRRKLSLTGNGNGTCAMQAINLPANISGWPEPGKVVEFCEEAIDAALGQGQGGSDDA